MLGIGKKKAKKAKKAKNAKEAKETKKGDAMAMAVRLHETGGPEVPPLQFVWNDVLHRIYKSYRPNPFPNID